MGVRARRPTWASDSHPRSAHVAPQSATPPTTPTAQVEPLIGVLDLGYRAGWGTTPTRGARWGSRWGASWGGSRCPPTTRKLGGRRRVTLAEVGCQATPIRTPLGAGLGW